MMGKWSSLTAAATSQESTVTCCILRSSQVRPVFKERSQNLQNNIKITFSSLAERLQPICRMNSCVCVCALSQPQSACVTNIKQSAWWKKPSTHPHELHPPFSSAPGQLPDWREMFPRMLFDKWTAPHCYIKPWRKTDTLISVTQIWCYT